MAPHPLLSHHRKVEGHRVRYLWIPVLLRLYGLFAPTSIYETVIFCLPFCVNTALFAECHSAWLRRFLYSLLLRPYGMGRVGVIVLTRGCGDCRPMWLMYYQGP